MRREDVGENSRGALRSWEMRRIWHNAALTTVTGFWGVWTWPHFRPAFTLASLLKLIVLAVLATVCYSATYLVDIPMQLSGLGATWQQWRWVVWLFGTLFALVFAYYWIADEIYPYVGAV